MFRITLEKYAHSLKPSGKSNRWNYEGEQVIYTSTSIELACLENLAHRTAKGLSKGFACMEISFPASMQIEEVTLKELPENWNTEEGEQWCRERGNTWLKNGANPILSIPSAVIPRSRNLIFSCAHPEFKHVKLASIEPFIFDKRLK